MNGQMVFSAAQNMLKQSRIPSFTTAMVLVEESDSRGYNMGTWAFESGATPATCDWVNTFAVNHGQSSTFGFADGHAEMRKWFREVDHPSEFRRG